MADLATTLPPEVEIGAMKRLEYSTDVVTMDSGAEVRNARWAAPLRVYEISFPHARSDNAIFLAVKALYEEALGQTFSFRFNDYEDNQTVTVRFDSQLEMESPGADLHHIVSVRLKEVR